MLFNSFSFILIFMPIVLFFWHGLNGLKKEKLADLFLIAASLVFYGFFSVHFVVLLLLTSVITYLVTLSYSDVIPNRGMCILGVIINLLVLGYYKYSDFFLENIKALTGREFTSLNLILPVGISFYVFGQIAFIIDRYREKEDGHPHLKDEEILGKVTPIEYLFYITYFPKIVQGPIALPSEIIKQLRSSEIRAFDITKFRKGIELFIIGLSKKVLLGDNLAKLSDYGFLYTYYMDTMTGIIVIISYAFQLYFDFSGYCDMAEGVSLMLGIELPVNFNSPYKSFNVRNFWQRWHMTLTRFFMRYVYIPLGGSRKGKIRTAINVLLVFILSGFWHGAGWTFICWGLIMGILVVFDDLGLVAVEKDTKKHYLLRDKPLFIIPRLPGQILTFITFLISLIFFRSQNMTYAIQMFKQLGIFTYPGFLFKTAENLDIPENYVILEAVNQIVGNKDKEIYLFTMLFIILIAFIVITRKNAHEIIEGSTKKKGRIIFFALLFIWSFISLSQVSTFLYFQF